MKYNLNLVEHQPEGWAMEWNGEIETEPNDGEFDVTLNNLNGDGPDVDVTVMVEAAEPAMWKFADDNDESFMDTYPLRQAGSDNGPAFVTWQRMYIQPAA